MYTFFFNLVSTYTTYICCKFEI